MRTAITCAALAATLLTSAAGCEKAGPKPSGKLTAPEAALLGHLPGDATVVFGGNFLKLQALLSRHAGIMPGAPRGIDRWTGCLASRDGMRMFGTVHAQGGLVTRIVATGVTIDQLAGCARDAGWASTIDADHKYIAITTGDGGTTLGYLALADGALYGFTAPPRGVETTRATLEADAAASTRASVPQNATLTAAVEHLDRSRAIWLVGSAAGTPLGDKLGVISGWIDVRDGLSAELDAEVKDDQFASRAVDGFGTLKTGAIMLGNEVKDALDHVELSRSGDHLKLRAQLSSAQLEALYAKLATMRR